MTREQAIEIAKINQKAYSAATIEHLFRGAPEPRDEDFGYHHGWYSVGEHSFCLEDLTGVPYDHTQGGWAYL